MTVPPGPNTSMPRKSPLVAVADAKLALIFCVPPIATDACSTVALSVSDATEGPSLVDVSAGAAGAAGTRGVSLSVATVMRLMTPSSSSQVIPSTTGRRRSTYVPRVVGARTRKVKVARPPGPTSGSPWIATRSAEGQPTPSALIVRSSPATPRLTC